MPGLKTFVEKCNGPLCIHSALTNCFNNVIFFVSITNYNFTFCPEMGKCSGYHPVSKSQFRQKVNMAPLCCQPSKSSSLSSDIPATGRLPIIKQKQKC